MIKKIINNNNYKKNLFLFTYKLIINIYKLIFENVGKII